MSVDELVFNSIISTFINHEKNENRYGNAIRTIPRSVLISLLLSRIPPHKIFLGKRVLRTQETPSYMTCYCDDGSEYQGSILIGADGTYSAVRKNMYQTLSGSESGTLGGEEEEGEGADGIIMADGRVMPHQHCVVGITESLDPKEFEALEGEYREFQVLRGAGHEHSVSFSLKLLLFVCLSIALKTKIRVHSFG